MSGLDYYRIVVLSKNDKIELEFHTKRLAIEKIIQLKMVDKEFIVGKVEEKINGKWVRILCLR